MPYFALCKLCGFKAYCMNNYNYKSLDKEHLYTRHCIGLFKKQTNIRFVNREEAEEFLNVRTVEQLLKVNE
jgi:hypothetical protein